MNDNRRKFLKVFVAITAGMGFLPQLKAKTASGEKIKMLTPDGKLVEVDKSLLKRDSGTPPASNKEVKEWMQTQPKNG